MTINLGLLDEESATEAIKAVAEIAEENGVDWALVIRKRLNLRKKMVLKFR